MFAAGAVAVDPKQLTRIRKDLPLYIFAGDKDPINAELTRLRPLVERYRVAGITDITTDFYHGRPPRDAERNQPRRSGAQSPELARARSGNMIPRIKKLIGTIVTLIWIPIYALFAMGIAVHRSAACDLVRRVPLLRDRRHALDHADRTDAALDVSRAKR